MQATHILISLFNFFVDVVVAAVGVYVIFEVFVGVNPDYDSNVELLADNRAVAILLAAIMFAAGMIIQKGIYPVVSLMRMYMTDPLNSSLSLFQVVVYSLAHLVMSFVLSVITISFSLRLFGRFTRNTLHAGKELKKGNVSVGILLASVVLLVAMFVGDGVSSLSKALIPQPSIGQIQIMH